MIAGGCLAWLACRRSSPSRSPSAVKNPMLRSSRSNRSSTAAVRPVLDIDGRRCEASAAADHTADQTATVCATAVAHADPPAAAPVAPHNHASTRKQQQQMPGTACEIAAESRQLLQSEVFQPAVVKHGIFPTQQYDAAAVADNNCHLAEPAEGTLQAHYSSPHHVTRLPQAAAAGPPTTVSSPQQRGFHLSPNQLALHSPATVRCLDSPVAVLTLFASSHQEFMQQLPAQQRSGASVQPKPTLQSGFPSKAAAPHHLAELGMHEQQMRPFNHRSSPGPTADDGMKAPPAATPAGPGAAGLAAGGNLYLMLDGCGCVCLVSEADATTTASLASSPIESPVFSCAYLQVTHLDLSLRPPAPSRGLPAASPPSKSQSVSPTSRGLPAAHSSKDPVARLATINCSTHSNCEVDCQAAATNNATDPCNLASEQLTPWAAASYLRGLVAAATAEPQLASLLAFGSMALQLGTPFAQRYTMPNAAAAVVAAADTNVSGSGLSKPVSWSPSSLPHASAINVVGALRLQAAQWQSSGGDGDVGLPMPALLVFHDGVPEPSPEPPTYSDGHAPRLPTSAVAAAAAALPTAPGLMCVEGCNIMLNYVPEILTLCSLDGRVTYQNHSSKAYHGDLLRESQLEPSVWAGTSLASASGFIGKLLVLEPGLAPSLVRAILGDSWDRGSSVQFAGGWWQGVVRVPLPVAASTDYAHQTSGCLDTTLRRSVLGIVLEDVAEHASPTPSAFPSQIINVAGPQATEPLPENDGNESLYRTTCIDDVFDEIDSSPSNARGRPSTARRSPSNARGSPSNARGSPLNTRGSPLNARGSPCRSQQISGSPMKPAAPPDLESKDSGLFTVDCLGNGGSYDSQAPPSGFQRTASLLAMKHRNKLKLNLLTTTGQRSSWNPSSPISRTVSANPLCKSDEGSTLLLANLGRCGGPGLMVQAARINSFSCKRQPFDRGAHTVFLSRYSLQRSDGPPPALESLTTLGGADVFCQPQGISSCGVRQRPLMISADPAAGRWISTSRSSAEVKPAMSRLRSSGPDDTSDASSPQTWVRLNSTGRTCPRQPIFSLERSPSAANGSSQCFSMDRDPAAPLHSPCVKAADRAKATDFNAFLPPHNWLTSGSSPKLEKDWEEASSADEQLLPAGVAIAKAPVLGRVSSAVIFNPTKTWAPASVLGQTVPAVAVPQHSASIKDQAPAPSGAPAYQDLMGSAPSKVVSCLAPSAADDHSGSLRASSSSEPVAFFGKAKGSVTAGTFQRWRSGPLPKFKMESTAGVTCVSGASQPGLCPLGLCPPGHWWLCSSGGKGAYSRHEEGASAAKPSTGPPGMLTPPSLSQETINSSEHTSAFKPDKENFRWHELKAQMVPDPFQPGGCGAALLLVQRDITDRMNIETTLADMSEGQLSLLSSIFPRHVVEHLALADASTLPSHFGDLARSHADVTILFLDIVGFTLMSNHVPASNILVVLNQLFTMFDYLADHHNVQKVDTAGDCYIAAGGMTGSEGEDGGFYEVRQGKGCDATVSARCVMDFAKDMLRCSREVLMPHNGQPVNVRIGLHTGPCVSGLVGAKVPKFSLFGDSINTASRMESTAPPGCIQVSAATHALLTSGEPRCMEQWQATEGLQVKSKGIMSTFVWTPPETGFYDLPPPPVAHRVLRAVRHPIEDPVEPDCDAAVACNVGLDDKGETKYIAVVQAATPSRLSCSKFRPGSGEVRAAKSALHVSCSSAQRRLLDSASGGDVQDDMLGGDIELINPGLRLIINSLHHRTSFARHYPATQEDIAEGLLGQLTESMPNVASGEPLESTRGSLVGRASIGSNSSPFVHMSALDSQAPLRSCVNVAREMAAPQAMALGKWRRRASCLKSSSNVNEPGWCVTGKPLAVFSGFVQSLQRGTSNGMSQAGLPLSAAGLSSLFYSMPGRTARRSCDPSFDGGGVLVKAMGRPAHVPPAESEGPWNRSASLLQCNAPAAHGCVVHHHELPRKC